MRPNTRTLSATTGARRWRQPLPCRSRRCHRPLRPPATSAASTPNATLFERGVEFQCDSSFYRWESAQARDLAVLAGAAYRSQHGRLHVLEVMAGSGVRSARYLQQAGADLVWCNDANPATHADAEANLRSSLLQLAARSDAAAIPSEPAHEVVHPAGIRVPQGRPPVQEWSVHLPGSTAPTRARLSHIEASRLLASCFLEGEHYDLIDVDSFGSDATTLPGALQVVRYGGLLYLTSTDGFSAGGRRPERSLAAYGAYLRPLPFANEQGLRALIGAAAKQAAAMGLAVEPLFSLYSFHGPVFRVMLRVTRGSAWGGPERYGFVGHCYKHSQGYQLPWDRLGGAWCRCEGCEAGAKPHALAVSGPMWTGPLHSADFLSEMAAQAQLRGWAGLGLPQTSEGGPRVTKKPNSIKPLEALLEVLQEEAQPALPPWYTPLDTIGRLAGACPSRPRLIASLQARGFAAARCHLEDSAIRTDARMADILAACRDDLGIMPRAAHTGPVQQGAQAAAATGEPATTLPETTE